MSYVGRRRDRLLLHGRVALLGAAWRAALALLLCPRVAVCECVCALASVLFTRHSPPPTPLVAD